MSVQNSSGTTLGCGRLETLFPVDASYKGEHIFSQFSQYLPARLPDLSILDIPQIIILDGIANTCSSKGIIFDPWSPGPQVGEAVTSDQFPVGDLPNHDADYSFVMEIPLIGNATILGHAVSSGFYAW